MTSTTSTRDWLLWSLSVVYLFGFASLFVQAPGLFGDNGITPSKHLLEKEAESVEEFLTNRPTLLRLLPKIGLDAALGIDFLCVAGVIVSFVAIISKDHRNALVAALQWIFYLSIAQVGQVFLSSKWDALLLETGFVAIFLAPLGLFGLHDWESRSPTSADQSPNHRLSEWLMKWILFRLVLGEGLTGLVNIFGMNYHQETTASNLQSLLHLHEQQILPTPVAWLVNLFPTYVVAMVTSIFILSNVLGSLLILLPSRKIRIVVFYWQCFSVATGMLLSNQGFYPLLVLTLSLSLLDDNFIGKLKVPWKKQVHANGTKAEFTQHDRRESPQNGFSGVKGYEKTCKDGGFWKSNILRVAVVSFLILCVLVCYGYPVLHSEKSQDDNICVELLVSALHSVYGFVGFIILLAILLGGTSLALECVHIFKKHQHSAGSTKSKRIINISRCSCMCILTSLLFLISLVPLTWFNSHESGQYLPNQLQQAYLWSHKHYKLVNNYVTVSKRVEVNGTAVGRLELILEGSRSEDSNEWMEYSFRFKPGNTATIPSIVAPHHPRLDENLWYAAQGNYKQHHWILNLVYRLLNNQEEVLELLGENPFPGEPPQYIKASLYEYQLANNDPSEKESSSSDWFTRKWIAHYLPIISKSDPSFIRYLKLSGLIRITDSKRNVPMQLCRETNILGTFVAFLRSLLGHSNGSCLCLVLVVLALLLALVDPSQKRSTANQRFQKMNDFDCGVYYRSGKDETSNSDIYSSRSRHPLG